MSSLNKIRLEDGTELAVSEWLHQPVFSTMEFGAAATAAGALNLSAFNYVVGQRVSSQGVAARNASEADTNIVRKRAMNQDESMIVFAITYEIFGLTNGTTGSSPSFVSSPVPQTDARNLRRLQLMTLVQLFVGANIKKPQVEVPFAWIHQSIGSPAWFSQSRDNPTSVAFNHGTGGVLSARNQELLKLPVYIGGFGENAVPGNMMTFYLKLTSAEALSNDVQLTQDLRVVWHLDGLKKRPA